MTGGGEMMTRHARFLTAFVFLWLASTWSSAGTVHHDLEVRIEPDEKSLWVVDRVSFSDAVTPDEDGAFRFVLHAGLEPKVRTAGWSLLPQDGPAEAGFLGINATTDTVSENVPLEAFLLVPEGDANEPVELVYAGVIQHDRATQGV